MICCGAHGGAGGRVLLVAVVVLDDLGLREVGRGGLGELHHEHRAGGEVRRVEQTGAAGAAERGQPLQRLVGQAGRAHHAVDPPRQRLAQRLPATTVGWVKSTSTSTAVQDVERGSASVRVHGEGRLLGPVRVDAADDQFHVVRRAVTASHHGPSPSGPRITRHRHLDHRKPAMHQSNSTRSVNAIVKQQRESEEETGGALTERVPQTVSTAR